jgi:hypothetical protein
VNLKAAVIAWTIAMEHNAVYKGLSPLVHPKDDDEYDTEKKRFFRVMYKTVARILEAPNAANDYLTEFWARTLGEERPEHTGSPLAESRTFPTPVRADDVLARARGMQVNPPNLNEACAEIATLQDRVRLLEKTLQQACIEMT